MLFWENKSVLVTGASGFVGNHLYHKLNKLGAKTYGTSRNKSHGNIYKINVLNFNELSGIVKKKKIQILFHLAGEALVEKGQENPYETFKANIDGTLNALEIARKNNLEKIVIASSSHVYGDNEAPYLEEYSPRPSRPYETSKTCTDLIAQSYADTFGLPVLIPRFVNIYGPGDTNFSRLIPKTFKSVLNGERPRMWGGKTERDYLYIDDAVNAYIGLGELDRKKIERNRIYNFGTGKTISVKNLMEKIIKVSKSDFKIEKNKEERLNEIDIQYVSSEKARRILGFKSQFDLNQGLGIAYEWYKDYFGGKK